MRVDLDKPSTWLLFKPTMCNGCAASCCKMPVDATVPDLVRMGVLSEDEAQWSARNIARKLIQDRVIVSYRASKMIFTIAQKSNRECVFLGDKTKLCTIYERRPDVCRRFPQVGPRPGYCPKNPKPVS